MPNFPSVIPQFQVIDPIGTYGCKFDHRVTFDGNCSVGAPGVITSNTINFTSADVGKRIVLTGAAASGAQYAGTISSINSTTSANVTPNISTTVTNTGLQVHTDDLQSWTNLITDLNNSVYPGGIIFMREAWIAAGFTNRSGISGFLPVINKQFQFFGIGGGATADTGDYTKIGGTCIAYAGTTPATTAFGAVMSIVPTLGVTAQQIKESILSNVWFDCRNGDQNEALKGLIISSNFGFNLEHVFFMDPAAIGIEFTVVGPGVSVPNAGALGEAKDCSRGTCRDIRFRCLDNPQAGAQTTPITTSSVITLSGTGQSLTVTANTLPTAGYIWIMTSIGVIVLANYTGGGGTTTLTGVTVNALDATYSYATVSGSNIVQAVPGNACSMLLDGDGIATTGANTNLTQFDTIIVSQGTTYGPAALEFRNSDSNLVNNLVINGGNAAVTSAINRITKPGIRLNGHSTAGAHARNNQFNGGSPGVGGCSAMALNSAGALLADPSGPNYWDLYQMGNGEPIPVREAVTASATQGLAGAFLDWIPNGGFRPGKIGPSSSTTQALTAGTAAVIAGATVAVPAQGFQIGTVIQWRIPVSKTAAGTAGNVISIHYGATGLNTDGTIATGTTVAGTAAIDSGFYIIDFVITALGTGTSGAALANCNLVHNLAAATGLGEGIAGTMTMTGFNTSLPNSGPAFLTIQINAGTSAVITVNPPVTVECINPSNP